MTSTQARDFRAVRFLVEEFIDVPETGETPEGVSTLQRKAARVLLPGPTAAPAQRPRRGSPSLRPAARPTYSLQQLALVSMPAAAFEQLRRDVRDWLRTVVRFPTVGHTRMLTGPLVLGLGATAGPPLVDASPLDLVWFYLFHLIGRTGVVRIGVCHAPKSQREAAEGECERLFVRRGNAKEFCSDRCRARVATQRARGVEVDLPRRRRTQGR